MGFYFSVECSTQMCSYSTLLFSYTFTEVDLQLGLHLLTELGYDVNSNSFRVTCLTNPESVPVADVLVEGELHETELGRLVVYMANRSPALVHLKQGTPLLFIQLLKGSIHEQGWGRCGFPALCNRRFKVTYRVCRFRREIPSSQSLSLQMCYLVLSYIETLER